MAAVTVGYGPRMESYNPNLAFINQFPELTRWPLTPIEEAKMAAVKVFEQFRNVPPTLCLSGGLDSECMALAFLEAKIPFRAATLVFENGLNDHDTKHAIQLCRQKNIDHEIISLDVVKFFSENRHLKYLEPYACHLPEIAVQLHFLENLPDPLVWAGVAFRVFSKNKDPKIQAISEIEAVIYRYLKSNNRIGVPNFNFYSVELAWSFFIQSLKKIDHIFEDDHDPEFYKEKLQFYLNCGFNPSLDNSRIQKNHGFELTKAYFDSYLKKNNLGTYQSVYRDPVKKKFPLAKNSIINIPKDDGFARKILALDMRPR